MTQTQVDELKSSIEKLTAHIEEKQDIADDLATLSRLQADLEGDAPFQLLHFLQNRSYQKALEFLDTGAVIDDPDRPDCDE